MSHFSRRMSTVVATLFLMVGFSTARAAEPTTKPSLDSLYAKREHKGSAGGTLPYRLLTPAGYDAKADTTYPLILLLHGAGERGSDNKAQLVWGGQWLATTAQAKQKSFVVAPQCPQGKQWVNTNWAKGSYSTEKTPISDELKMALEIVDATIGEFKIDKSRVYVMGLSMGGYGTWDAIARRPELFAAAMPICGAGDPSMAPKLKNVAIWAFHGDADTAVPTQGSRDMAEAFKKAGATEPKFKYTEYPGVGHDSWNKAWKEPELAGWMFSQKLGK